MACSESFHFLQAKTSQNVLTCKFTINQLHVDFIVKDCKRHYQVTSILSCLFVLQILKGQNLSGALPRETPPKLHYESITGLTVHWDPSLYFTTFEISILVQKTDISRTAWINPWACIINWDRYYKVGQLFFKSGAIVPK